MTELTARKLLLDLATARPRTRYSIAALCRAGQIVGLSAPSIRMAATRLHDEGVLDRDGRGSYTLHPEALLTYPHVRDWAARHTTRTPWTGTWAAVDNSTTARTDRAVLRHHDRAVDLLGFRPWRGALHIRPDNLTGGITALRDTLQATGMAPGAAVFGVHDLDPAHDTELRGLWDTAALTTRLDQTTAALTASLDRLPTLTAEEFAHESLLLGSQAIATILHDPLLPDDLCDPEPHRRLTTLAQTYQDTAQAIWAQLLNLEPERP
ncbi:hypothetical protein [Actinomadura formosensis]|uniref:hypothetical protein n=1 Tax=Actinomadura formosensis TaxID=60706 RepID=UPI00082F8010|nr:hypothetical protein [Actinomadura formosensis]